MKNQKKTHLSLKPPKGDHQHPGQFRWARIVMPPNASRSWTRVVYDLSISTETDVLVQTVAFGGDEPRRVVANRLRYTKKVLLRQYRLCQTKE